MLPEEEKRQIQLVELEILDEFERLCRLGGLRYYIIAGTLLGAVRHKGFIPWDDDMDVAMPRKDFERFFTFCQTALAPEFFFQSLETDQNCPFFHYKLRKNGTFVEEPGLKKIEMHKGIFIDIFPLDGCPEKDLSGKLFFKWFEQLRSGIQAQVNPDFVCGYTKSYARATHTLIKKLPRSVLIGIWKLTSRISSLCFKKKLCTVCGRHGYPGETYQTAWYQETVFLDFEGRKLPAPAGWDAMLTNLYGDYMTPPPESERQGHFE